MKSLLLWRKKRGLSNLVAYVLLISMTISLSILVYGWLRFYVTQGDVEICPEGVSLIINNYECVSGVDGYLNLTLKNKGLFSVDGYILRVHDREDAEFGFYIFDRKGEVILPGNSVNKEYSFADYTEKQIEDLTFVEIQPYVENGKNLNCEAYASQKVECN